MTMLLPLLRRRNDKTSGRKDVLALAAFLQSQLEIIVITVTFYQAGLWWMPKMSSSWQYGAEQEQKDEEEQEEEDNDAADADDVVCWEYENPQQQQQGVTSPCSLVTIEPYAPGGLRRLVINVHSPLIKDITRAFNAGHYESVVRIGKAMIMSGTWPIKGLDVPQNTGIRWKAMPGVIACPDALAVCPVPHEEMKQQGRRKTPVVDEDTSAPKTTTTNTNNKATVHRHLVIWPLRICSIWLPKNRGLLENKGQPKTQKEMLDDVANSRKHHAFDDNDEPPTVHDDGIENGVVEETETASGGGADILHVTRIHELWDHRDRGLELEFRALVAREQRISLMTSMPTCWWSFSAFRRKIIPLPRQHQEIISWNTHLNPSSAVVTMAPALPVYVVASCMLNNTQRVDSSALPVSCITALPQAASWLLRNDRLFCLSLFFGFPLMDRTGVLQQSIRVAPYSRRTPSRSECCILQQRWLQHQKHDDDQENVKPVSCHESLRHLMLQRARGLWDSTERAMGDGKEMKNKEGSILVAWSGGIDSTAVLCALLEVARERPGRLQRLAVLLDDESISENPSFYQHCIVQEHGLEVFVRNGEPLSTHAVEWSSFYHRQGRGKKGGHQKMRNRNTNRNTNNRSPQRFETNIMVTGELGDQLFGSAKLKAAFPDDSTPTNDLAIIWGAPSPRPLSQQADTANALSPREQVQNIFTRNGLKAPWEETMLPALECLGLLGEGNCDDWKEWIRPQLEVSPLPIRSTFDFLWWVNFSCKWQNVELRCVHDGGKSLISSGGETTVSELTRCIRHFFDDRNLECWSCIPEFHSEKFPDLTSWATFKEPLKRFIRDFDGDDVYYREKTKVGSLNFGAPEGPESYTNCFYGATITIPHPSQKTEINPMAKLNPLVWGACGMAPPDDLGLCHLLDPSIRSALDQRRATKKVNPWSMGTLDSIKVEDNDVDMNVMARRALLENDIICGRTLLDLNAGLGEVCLRALHVGSTRITAIENDDQALERLRLLIEQVHVTDARPHNRVDLVSECNVYDYLVSCNDASHDVIVATGVLENVLDPLSLLGEMARVSSHAILLDMPHAKLNQNGHVQDPDGPTADFGGLKASARTASGLMQATRTGGRYRVLPPRATVEEFMENLGWSVRRVLIEEHPDNKALGWQYTTSPMFGTLPSRYLLQCFRRTTLATTETLRPSTTANPCREHQESTHDEAQQEFTTKGRFQAWKDIDSSSEQVHYETDDCDSAPFSMRAWSSSFSHDEKSVGCVSMGTVYGYVLKGPVSLTVQHDESGVSRSFILYDGMYFASPGRTTLHGGSGIVQLVKDHVALFAIGGPVESGPGRLPYIDGCTDTLLLSPTVMGAPCLNHLHFPPGIKQTQHTHPSGRSGMIIRGSGVCICVEDGDDDDYDGDGDHVSRRIPLKSGMAFVIPSHVRHAFETGPDEFMDVIAFHPDSDFGPTSSDHPMVNRTIVEGVSASLLPSIQTK